MRAAAALALGMYQQESIVARVLEMGDGAAVRDHLLAQLKSDAAYRLLARKLSPARRLELRALGIAGPEHHRAAFPPRRERDVGGLLAQHLPDGLGELLTGHVGELLWKVRWERGGKDRRRRSGA